MRAQCRVPALLLVLAAAPAAANEPLDLQWAALIPGGEAGAAAPRGMVEHGELPAGPESAGSYEVVHDFDGKTVRLPGYLVPLDLGLAGGTEFLLVPYFGACIHVPPPPPNQIVYVTTEDAYAMEALFEPVFVTGRFDTVTLATDLAEVAYSLSADSIDAYTYE